MDAYKTPASDLHVEGEIEYRPLAGLLIGLCFAVLLTSLTSTILCIAFGVLLGADLSSENFVIELASNNFYLLTDIAISAIVVFYAGRATGKRTHGKEIKFGAILAIITLAMSLLLSIYTDAFSIFPAWYTALATISIIILIPFGAKSVANT
ncbi:hypothetical protein [Pseudomonas sp.]|uniref:hypothetical protein n=1 Tax=Pseudomonas sp. TaxID=306 RepID=UPI0027326AB3|nr:hypothetical protein [Pseudomonas sp.]MDP3815805.1 hypothetical protein [Pseudomonas sp.]